MGRRLKFPEREDCDVREAYDTVENIYAGLRRIIIGKGVSTMALIQERDRDKPISNKKVAQLLLSRLYYNYKKIRFIDTLPFIDALTSETTNQVDWRCLGWDLITGKRGAEGFSLLFELYSKDLLAEKVEAFRGVPIERWDTNGEDDYGVILLENGKVPCIAVAFTPYNIEPEDKETFECVLEGLEELKTEMDK